MHTTLHQTPTNDLLHELHTRYDELIFIGVLPTRAIMTQGNPSSTPIIDVHTKIESQASQLNKILGRIAANLTSSPTT